MRSRESLLSNPQWRDMAHRKEWQDIYSAALDCDLLFDKCLTQIVEPGTISLLGEAAVTQGQLAINLHARFQAWSSYLGVFAEQNACLDRRLSCSKEIQDMVINHLETLFLNLQRFVQITQIREDSDSNETLQWKTNVEDFMADLRKTGEYIEGSVDRLHRLGKIIRQTSTASLISRVRAFSAKKSDSSLENTSYLVIRHLYPEAPLSLQRLLGQSILERHYNMEYRREHPIQTDKRIISQSGSKPSTLQTDEFNHRLEPRKQSPPLSTVPTTPLVPTEDISYPQPPRPLGDGNPSWATCHWCSESYPYNKFQDKSWWRRHVDHDFQPYICLFDTCPYSPGFDSFSSWAEHMEKHHSPNWIAKINSKAIWRCKIGHELPELFDDEASLRDHMRKHHLDSYTEHQLGRIARRGSIRIPGSQDICPICGRDPNNDLIIADELHDSQHSYQNKRKRESEPIIQTQLNINDQGKRRKVIIEGERAIIANESASAGEPASELASSQKTESILPQSMDQLRRERLLIHIAEHLQSLSFMSLRLNAFQEQYEKRGDDFTM
ncbi:hypothetical protein J3E68DRAFT_401724 [Trichoderma sp. SZMC 28012]